MNRDPGAWVSPLVALAVLGLVIAQTLAALRVSGAYGWHPTARAATTPAFVSLDSAIGRHDPSFTLQGLRDPFAFGPGDAKDHRLDARPKTRPKPAPPVRLAEPLLTAILWDNDPRALVRWKDREWTVREGGLFDEFQVLGITRDQVTLRRGDETLVLKRRNLGE